MSVFLRNLILQYGTLGNMSTASTKEKEQLIESILRPETETERNILADPEFKEGLFFGKPRYGHPEGKVVFHIREVFENIDTNAGEDKELRRKLRLIALIHDTFKYKEQKARSIFGRKKENHHAVFAANFAEAYVKENDVLKIIKRHDDAYYAWKETRFGYEERSNEMLRELRDDLGSSLDLFYRFFKCDTQTGDKTQEPVAWFEEKLAGELQA